MKEKERERGREKEKERGREGVREREREFGQWLWLSSRFQHRRSVVQIQPVANL